MTSAERESLWRQSGYWRWIVSLATLALAMGLAGLGLKAPPAGGPPAPSTYVTPSASAPTDIRSGAGSAVPQTSSVVQPAAAPPAMASPDNAGNTSPPAPGQTRSLVTWNQGGYGAEGTVSGGGLIASYCCAGAASTVWASKGIERGRHYWELTLSARPGESAADTWTAAGVEPHASVAVSAERASRRMHGPGGSQSGLSVEVGRDRSIRNGDVLMFALDADKHVAYWGVNGQWRNGIPGQQGGASLQLRPGEQFVAFGRLSASSANAAPEGDRWIANFGGRKFKYPIPPGFDSYGSSGRSGSGVAATAASSPLPPPAAPDALVGQVFGTSVTVSGQAVPLPDGKWLVLSHFKGSLRSPGDAIVLGQVVSGQLRRMVVVHAYRRGAEPALKVAGFRSCSRQDIVFSEQATSLPESIQCWWVNHATSVWQEQALLQSAHLELEQRKISFPAVFMNVGFHRANPDGFATSFYYFDPAEEGIASSPITWQLSEWHKSRIEGDPQRKAYVEKSVAWGRNWAPIYFAAK